jgi:hypothetical protein
MNIITMKLKVFFSNIFLIGKKTIIDTQGEADWLLKFELTLRFGFT